MNKRNFWPKPLPYLVLVLVFFISACNDTNNLSSLTQKSLIYCSEASPENFNPQTTTNRVTIEATANQIYDRLITINPVDNTLMPALAKSWHITSDGKKFTFYLQKNISFHATDYFYPTRTLTADDVVFSFQRIIDFEHDFHYVSAGKYPYFEQIGFDKTIASIEKIDPLTVRFVLNRPDASFLAHLATQYAVILSAEYADLLASKQMHRNIDTHPIGTGPFKLKDYRVGSLIRFYRHDLYWQKKVPFEQLVYDITTNNTGRLTKLMTGECDIISDPIGHNKIIEHKKLTLESVTSLDTAFLTFNALKPPFNNPLVRQAIGYAINKEAIVNAVYYGRAVVATSLLPPTSWGFSPTLTSPSQDLEQAKKLMADAGYKDGFNMDLWASPNHTSYNPNALTMAILIQENLKEIGITVNIVHDDPKKLLLLDKNLSSYQSMLHGWTANNPDPDNFFNTLLSCESTETGSNISFWCHQGFDALLLKSIQTNKIEQRKLLYQQAQVMLDEQMPIIPIAHSKVYKAKNNNIHGEFFDNFGVNFINMSKN